MTNERQFPIQARRGAKPHPLLIPWSVAELAYSVYAARYGKDQSLAHLAGRGGFCPDEMDEFLPGWRERCDEIIELREALQGLLDAQNGTYDKWYVAMSRARKVLEVKP